jgi:hypothetical protein
MLTNNHSQVARRLVGVGLWAGAYAVSTAWYLSTGYNQIENGSGAVPYLGFCLLQLAFGAAVGRVWALVLPLLIFVVTLGERNECLEGTAGYCGWVFYAIAFYPAALACVAAGFGLRAGWRLLRARANSDPSDTSGSRW